MTSSSAYLGPGGSMTHLTNLLELPRPDQHGIARFVVWRRSAKEPAPAAVEAVRERFGIARAADGDTDVYRGLGARPELARSS